MISPCTKQCGLENGSCVSCKRTSEEIVKWRGMTDSQRNTILKDIEKGR
jgi:predicted Fe-S protein YdhL (DUF1289 family)